MALCVTTCLISLSLIYVLDPFISFFTGIISIGMIIFLLFSFFLYHLKKEFFFKLALVFSKKMLLVVTCIYAILIGVTFIKTSYIVDKVESHPMFRQFFPNVFPQIHYKNILTLLNVVHISASENDNLDDNFEEKIAFLKQFDIPLELHLQKENQENMIGLTIVFSPLWISKSFCVIVVYFYCFVFYRLLRNYLQQDAKLKHSLPVVSLIGFIFFLFIQYSILCAKITDQFFYRLIPPISKHIQSILNPSLHPAFKPHYADDMKKSPLYLRLEK